MPHDFAVHLIHKGGDCHTGWECLLIEGDCPDIGVYCLPRYLPEGFAYELTMIPLFPLYTARLRASWSLGHWMDGFDTAFGPMEGRLMFGVLSFNHSDWVCSLVLGQERNNISQNN